MEPGKKITGKEITLGELFDKLGTIIKYLISKWLIILAFSIIGAIAGVAYSIYQKPVYTAVNTFVLEDGSKTGALGQYASLASLAGIDLNGGGSGLFQGDNILELYKSRAMIEKTLLSEVVIGDKKQLLIDRYVAFNELKDKWKRKDDINDITFAGNPAKFNRKQDSIITDLVDFFNKKLLRVNRLDKKLNIIVVQVDSKDEIFAQQFTKRLVQVVNNFYVVTKTKKSYQNVMVLQHQADSVKAVLNSSISGVAAAIDAAPNANPQLLTLKVPSQRRQVDVQASSAVYGEIVKNLEISRISLRQDVPLIQVIDEPVLPLANNHVGKVKGAAVGVLLCFIAISLLLTVKRQFGPTTN